MSPKDAVHPSPQPVGQLCQLCSAPLSLLLSWIKGADNSEVRLSIEACETEGAHGCFGGGTRIELWEIRAIGELSYKWGGEFESCDKSCRTYACLSVGNTRSVLEGLNDSSKYRYCTHRGLKVALVVKGQVKRLIRLKGEWRKRKGNERWKKRKMGRIFQKLRKNF